MIIVFDHGVQVSDRIANKSIVACGLNITSRYFWWNHYGSLVQRTKIPSSGLGVVSLIDDTSVTGIGAPENSAMSDTTESSLD